MDTESQLPEKVASHPLFSGARMGIMTADKPKFKAEDSGGNAALRAHLDKLGLRHETIIGHYDEPEESLVVHGPSRAQMYELGKRFGQESTIFSEAGRHHLIYANGPHEGKYVTTSEPHVSYFANRPSGGFSAVPNGPGFFRMNFQFGNPMPLEIHNSDRPQPPASPNLHSTDTRKAEMIDEVFDALLKADRFDVAEGHYHWLADHHRGAGSKEYGRLSKLSRKFKPGLHASAEKMSSESKHIYDNLCEKRGCNHPKLGGEETHKSEPIDLRAALIERLKKAEAELLALHKAEATGSHQCDKCGSHFGDLKPHGTKDHAAALLFGPEPRVLHPADRKKVHKAEAIPGQNPSLPNAGAPDLNAAPDSPVGAGNQVPVGQLGPEGQAEMETGGGNCPLCGQPDLPGKCTCLQHGPAAPPAAPAAAAPAPAPAPLQLSEKKPVGTESAFKLAWADYDKKAAKAKKSFDEHSDLRKAQIGANTMPTAPMAMKSEPCKGCGKSGKLCKCISKTDLIDSKGKKVETGVVGKRPQAGGGKEIKNPGNGSVSAPKANSHAVKPGVEKAEPPMAKPPSGKNPATMTPSAKPAAPAAGGIKPIALPKPAVPKLGAMPKPGAMPAVGKAEDYNKLPPADAKKITSRGRAVGALPAVGKPVAKAALPANAVQAQQHGLTAASIVAAPKPAALARPLQHPANMGRANAMSAAIAGAFKPSGPVKSGLELARPAKVAAAGAGMKPPLGKSERCPFCAKADHFGDCKP